MSSRSIARDVAMMEKYLHSQGAAYYDEGRLDDAISWLKKAIGIDERPYTRYHLALALHKKGDLADAVAEISRAIDLNGSVPEYYYERSLLWGEAGDGVRSEQDMVSATTLDHNYRRIGAIRSAITAANQVFYNAGVRSLPDTHVIAHRELQAAVRTVEETRESTGRTFEQASCTLPCPSYCCHFSEAPLLHGIYIGPWKLLAVRTYLGERGVSEKGFLDRIPFKREEHFTRTLPPHIVVREGGSEFVYAPKRTRRFLGKRLLRYVPKGSDYRSLLWINETARACSFLSGGKCLIHDLAGEPGLPSCKEFLCLTGFTVVILKHLGMVDQGELETKSLQDLNSIAVEALIILYNRLYGNDALMDLGKVMEDALEQACEADRRGETDDINNSLGVFRRVKKRHGRLFGLQKDSAAREIMSLFR